MFLCAAFAKAQKGDALPEGVRQKADVFYYDAVRARLAGKHAEAYQLYAHVLELDPAHVGANYDLSSYYHLQGNDSLASHSLQEASHADPDNYWVKQALVQLLVSQDKNDEAVTALEEMAASYPDNSEILFMLEDMYQKTGNYKKVIETLDRIELLEGKNEEISTEKYRTFIRMHDEEKAFAAMRQLAEEYPNDMRYKVLIGDLYMDAGKYDQAYQEYQKLQKEDPVNVHLLLSLARYYETQHLDSLYQENLISIVTSESLPEESRLRIMQGLAAQNLFQAQVNDTTKMIALFDHILQKPQENNAMPELYVRYLISSNADKNRIKPVLHQMLETDPEADIARNQLLSYAIDEDNDNEVERLCNTAVEYGSKNPVYYYYLGVVNVRKNRFNQAIEATRKGLGKLEDRSSVDMIVNMYAILGDCYHRTGRNQQAFECYDSCLLYKPNEALVLNNYAYYLSLEKRNLDKAEQMSAKAIELVKDNPTYIDTYAWVLFQQQKYAKAKVYIDEVLNLLGDSITKEEATLMEHAGDIYFKCGYKLKAFDYWNKAKSLGGGSALLERKIKKKKYIEQK